MNNKPNLRRLLSVVCALLLISLTSCGKYSLSAVNAYRPTYDEFNINLGNRKMDILFVIDNSGSMGDQQMILADSFEGFIGSFVTHNIDYHMGVISTDNRLAGSSVWATGWGSGYFNDGPSSLLFAKTNGPDMPMNKFLDSSMGASAVVSAFKNNAKLGTNGSGDEAALLSLTRFLAPDRQVGWNSGFMRSDSLLAAVIVSDEDESRTACDVDALLPNSLCDQPSGRPAGDSYVYADSTAKAYRKSQFLTAFRAQRPKRPSLLRLDAVIVKPATVSANNPKGYDQSCLDSGESDGKPGKLYNEVVTELKGSLSSVCGNFSTALRTLGNTISSSVENEFELSSDRVDPQSVVVVLNGEQLDSSAFSFSSTDNTVIFGDDTMDMIKGLNGVVNIKVYYDKRMNLEDI